MSVSNTFSWKRFLLVCKQNLINNKRLMVFASVGYIGMIFIVLTIAQASNDFNPLDIKIFIELGITFLIIFGILYIGYSFPDLRNKESSISYLTVPASIFEKMLFEFINRIVLALIVLPLLFWFAFNVHGIIFELARKIPFDTIGVADFMAIDIASTSEMSWVTTLVISCTILVSVLPFTGAAIFSKQPLIKSMFSVAILLMGYFGIIYIIMEPLGLGEYEVNRNIVLLPEKESSALQFFTVITSISTIVMLVVTYLKLKEKEV